MPQDHGIVPSNFIDDVQLAYSYNSICRMVTDKWIDMVITCNDVLHVSVAEKLGDGSMIICFCCVDSPSMDIIRTPCCKNSVHRHCILHNMTINSQFVYCRKVLQYQDITDCPAEPRTTTVHISIHWWTILLIRKRHHHYEKQTVSVKIHKRRGD
jgi:hypothetical protein